MKELHIATKAIQFDTLSELPEEDRNLLHLAKEAASKAYAPYSKFKVGAVFLLENGQVVTGSNQENAAYPSGMCAERVGVWKVGSEYPNITIKKLAIVATATYTEVSAPVGPCGACRQTLLEYETNQKEPIEVFFMGEKGPIIKTHAVVDLLPFSFDASYLE